MHFASFDRFGKFIKYHTKTIASTDRSSYYIRIEYISKKIAANA